MHKIDFKEEFDDLITLLNHVTESPQAFQFEDWMFYFMETVSIGRERINWARIVSNNLDIKLKRLQCTKTFYISSYLIYSLARAHEYAGLMYRGPVGMGAGEIRACESYTQLHYPGKAHYKRVNDAFTMHLTRMLQGGIHQRLSS